MSTPRILVIFALILAFALAFRTVPAGAQDAIQYGPDTPSGSITVDVRLCDIDVPDDRSTCPIAEGFGSVLFNSPETGYVLNMSEAAMEGGVAVWGGLGLVPLTTYLVNIDGVEIPDGYGLAGLFPTPGTDGGGSENGWYVTLSEENPAAHLQVVLFPQPGGEAPNQPYNSITVYQRFCPAGYEGEMYDIDCTETRGDAAIQINTPGLALSDWGTTGPNGTTDFFNLYAGTYEVRGRSLGIERIYVRCSASGDTEVREATYIEDGEHGLAVNLDEADILNCAWFNFPFADNTDTTTDAETDTSSDTDGNTDTKSSASPQQVSALPKTGSSAASVAGHSSIEAGLSLLLAAAVALGGVLLAPRRRA